jgi:tripartite-type tricarboxylate transporter receptor subunit TctC
MTYSRRKILKVAAAAPALSFPSIIPASAFAQADYPNRQINAICMFPACTGADVFVRFYGDQLQKRLGKPVIVENKVGAFGLIATQQVAQSRPDGYTIYIAPGSSVLAAAQHLYKQVPYDPVKDFQSVTTLAKLTFILCVAPDNPFRTVQDLVAHLQERGDKSSYGSAANTGLVSSELFKAAFGLKTVEVKYRDAATALNDLWGRQIDFIHLDPVAVLEQARAGKVRTLVTASQQRMSAMPNIPSASEFGIKGDVVAWWSVHVPAKTHGPIVDKLEATFNDIVASNEAKTFLANQGSDSFPGNRKVLDEILARDLKAWGEYVALAKNEKV